MSSGPLVDAHDQFLHDSESVGVVDVGKQSRHLVADCIAETDCRQACAIGRVRALRLPAVPQPRLPASLSHAFPASLSHALADVLRCATARATAPLVPPASSSLPSRVRWSGVPARSLLSAPGLSTISSRRSMPRRHGSVPSPACVRNQSTQCRPATCVADDRCGVRLCSKREAPRRISNLEARKSAWKRRLMPFVLAVAERCDGW